MRRILVAGIGNIFLGDDGFGVEVAQRFAAAGPSPGVEVRDFGIRGLHLAYQMLDGTYDSTIFVDAVPRGGAPGSLYLIEPELENLPAASADAHSMDPVMVLGLLKTLGGSPGRILIVGCEPASLEEGIGLSPPVAKAASEALEFLREIVARELLPRLPVKAAAGQAKGV
jgi:hydrogenase maturation protease